jgi:hypothetical protein
LEDFLMSNILNPKPRFGYNPTTDMIYDYVAQKDVTAAASYTGIDGNWNLLEVKRAILANETIETARLTVVKPAPKPVAKPGVAPAPLAPVAAAPIPLAPGQVASPAAGVPHVPGQAQPTTVRPGIQPTTGADGHPTPGTPGFAGMPGTPGVAGTPGMTGTADVQGIAAGGAVSAMSVAQLQALKLSPLQMAAMGLTPTQMNVTGVTGLQVSNWGLTPARADALRLTKEQRLGLKIP